VIGNFTSVETANALKVIFEKHKNERVCVIGTMCCGKSTLIKQFFQYDCIDVDDKLWSHLSKEETEKPNIIPFTKEIMDSVYKLAYEKITVKPGFPLFGFVILDCEVVVYLDISEKLLEEHCEKRGDTSLTNALFVKKGIEEDWNNHKLKNDKTFYYLTITE